MYHQNNIYLGTIKDKRIQYVLNAAGFPIRWCEGEDVWDTLAWRSFDDGIFEPHRSEVYPMDYPLVQGTDSNEHCCLVAVVPGYEVAEDEYLMPLKPPNGKAVFGMVNEFLREQV